MRLEAPSSLDVQVDQTIRFADHSFNGFSLDDPDSNEHTYRVRIVVSSGKLILSAGIVTESLVGNGTANLQLSGSLETINRALNLLAYNAGSKAGQQTLNIVIDSLDSSGRVVTNMQHSVKMSLVEQRAGFATDRLLPGYQSLPINLDFDTEILSRSLSNGSVLLGSTIQVGPHTDLVFANFDAQGKLIPTFGGVGLATLNLGEDEILVDMVADSRGGFLALVYEPLEQFNRISVVAMAADGTINRAFGYNGIASVHSANTVPKTMSLGRQGQLFVSGSAGASGNEIGFVYAFTQDGRQISDFGSDGLVLLPEPITTQVLDNENRLTLGSTNKVFRLLPQGTPDRTFDFDGQVDLTDNRWTKQILVSGTGS